MQSPDIQRIEHIKEYCSEIIATIQRYGDTFEIFDKDLDFQKSISFSILQIGEHVGKLSDGFRAETNTINWSAIKGMRNFFAHNYGSMNRMIIWKTATCDIPNLLDFCNEILK